MSLSLLKRELNLASELREESSTNKKRSKKVNHLGTERHGMKKRLKMLKSQKKKSEKFSFKFSTEDSLIKKDKTLKGLEQLNKLDKISKKVSSKKIVEDVSKRKRQTERRQAESASTSKEDKSSILLSEEEVAALEKAYFIHSREKPKPKDDWD